MLLVLLHDLQSSQVLIASGCRLAQNLKKDFGIITYVQDDEDMEAKKSDIESGLSENTFEDLQIFVRRNDPIKELAADCERLEASFLLIQWNGGMNKQLRNYLNSCRDLRIPYLFFKDEFPLIRFEKVLVPVGFLIEEYEKTQFASAFGRFCRSEITVLQANDYGSKAKTTIEKMKMIFNKFELKYTVEKARADSYKLDKEAMLKAKAENYSLLLVSASRDYGLDDLVFGPKEYHLVKKSKVPILLVNPRGDLYTLCD